MTKKYFINAAPSNPPISLKISSPLTKSISRGLFYSLYFLLNIIKNITIKKFHAFFTRIMFASVKYGQNERVK